MLISPGCIPCIVNQSYTLSRLLGVENKKVQSQIIYETINSLLDNKEIPTAPHFSIKLQSIINKNLNGASSFKRIKENNRAKAERYMKYLETMVDASDDKLEIAVRIAITGNTIDLGANPDFDIAKEVNLITSNNINLSSFQNFKEDFGKASLILYIGDNYEEALFDEILLRQLLPKRVVFAVRSKPILNDITLDDAKNLELNEICEIVESGSTIAGTDLKQCTPEFLELYKKADLVIAKGQGNYETLMNEERPIYFLFKVKCEVISRRCGLPEGASALFFNKQ